MEANLDRGARLAAAAKVTLRPHIKTHKSLKIALEQEARGAGGITASKPEEALVFLRSGLGSLTVAYPLVDRAKIARLLHEAAQRGAELTLIADSRFGVQALAGAAGEVGSTASVMLKVDVGLHRCGIDPEAPEALALATEIARTPSLAFAGLLSHAGHAYGAKGPDEVRAVARGERQLMMGLASRLSQAGLDVPRVSVGSTPTVFLNDGFEGITEVRPGNYVFMDLTQVALGVARMEDIALSVLATVVSRNDRYLIVDAGSKVLSSDRGPHGSDRIAGFGKAIPLTGGPTLLPVSRLSEEHGFVEHGGAALPIGARLKIYPNHACPVPNLADAYVVLDGDGFETWPVDARGKVQ